MFGLIIKQMNQHFLSMNQPFLAILYTTLFATTYFGMFRVGEVTSGDHPVRVTDIKLGHNKNKVLFILRTSKTHGLNQKPQKIKITSTKLNHHRPISRSNKYVFCPYKLLRKYIKMRPKYKHKEKPFFVFHDRNPVRPVHMRKTLKKMLKLSGFKHSFYNTHSLRAGRSVDLLKLNVDLKTICILGRWRSNAVYSCITSD